MQPKNRKKRWKTEELRYLEWHLGETSLSLIAKRLGRSMKAVSLKAGRLRLRGRSAKGYSQAGLSRRVGYSQASVAKALAALGVKKAKRVHAPSHHNVCTRRVQRYDIGEEMVSVIARWLEEHCQCR